MPSPAYPTAPVAAAGLVGGFAVVRWSGRPELGGVVLAVGGAVAGREWVRAGGAKVAGGLGAGYLAAFAGAHPLAKRLGAWPSVLAVAGGVALASWALVDRRER
ncbi:hypothetical protein [Streptomyces sp. NPDC050560]|uniref:hypothetical protein n=1 Tax=Streptomyces sp. NPDC050560 TaxID=3365630 RepID=UPI00378B8750